jgi:hypothetical protein
MALDRTGIHAKRAQEYRSICKRYYATPINPLFPEQTIEMHIRVARRLLKELQKTLIRINKEDKGRYFTKWEVGRK